MPWVAVCHERLHTEAGLAQGEKGQSSLGSVANPGLKCRGGGARGDKGLDLAGHSTPFVFQGTAYYEGRVGERGGCLHTALRIVLAPGMLISGL